MSRPAFARMRPLSARFMHQVGRLRSTARSRWGQGARLVLAGAGIAGTAVYLASSQPSTLDAHEDKQRVKAFATKVDGLGDVNALFDEFASVTKEGEKFMTREDFLRSFTARDFFLQGMRRCPHVAGPPPPFLGDCESSLVSREEFAFWLSLLSVREEHLPVAFRVYDVDGNGTVDFQEFADMLAHVAATFARRSSPFGTSVRDCAQELGRLNAGRELFGRDFKRAVPPDQFGDFLRLLRRSVLQYKFDCYRTMEAEATGMTKIPTDVSAMSLARALAAHAKHSKLPDLLQRIQTCSRMRTRFSFDEFHATLTALVSFPNDLCEALRLCQRIKGQVKRKDFRLAVTSVTGVKLSMDAVDVVFCVFDSNRDGSLEVSELSETLSLFSSDLSAQSRPSSTARFWKCVQDTYEAMAE